ncbi:peroxidase-like isoform X1 [Onthophagus taurus]|uniref:peroxidase-like isoform X1 n=1 Tax=Onthophagus taurus TaxID=166361 RepID=UPI0039BDCFA6
MREYQAVLIQFLIISTSALYEDMFSNFGNPYDINLNSVYQRPHAFNQPNNPIYSTGFGQAQPQFQPNFPQFQQQFQPQFQTTTPDPATLGCGTAPASCQPSRYRTLDGSCNNLRNPGLGIPQTRFNRLVPPNYGDGISTPTRARSGNELPPARSLSLILYPDVPVEDPKFTVAAMQYGQIITHDMSMIAGSTQAQPHDTKCCSPTGQLLELANSPEHCFPLTIARDDPINQNTLQPQNCMSFVRTITDRDRNCVGGSQPAEQISAVNHFLDLSVVYGNTDQVSAQVRLFQGGRLTGEFRNGQEWLPRNNNASGVCDLRLNPQEACYAAGDVRVNQNPQLTILQIILFREHNRLADSLSKINPHWDDETLYQEARKINIAQHQFISYYEWLPIFIGVGNSLKNRIIWDTKDFVNDYDENVDPTVINEHATAAFRFFHSLIAGHLDLVGEYRNNMGNIRMSDWFNRPAVLEQGTNFDDLTRGMASQPELKSDRFHDSEITQFLFRMGQFFGQDLKAICIQRNRDHGLASYNDVRQFCGLGKASSFDDLLDVMTKDNVNRLANLYESVDDIDLTVGGSLEILVPGTLSGPTFLCILTEQFYRTRAGDRFWFENSGPTGFNLDQLNEIRKTSLARLFCDNANVRSMQPRGFIKISDSNPVVSCEQIPSVNLNLWRDSSNSGSQFTLENPHDFYYKK